MFLKEQERKPYQRLKLGNDPRHLDPKNVKRGLDLPRPCGILKFEGEKKCKVGAYASND